jgi:hypothetical protein
MTDLERHLLLAYGWTIVGTLIVLFVVWLITGESPL